jgi:predicted HTH transcriptional regulator
MATIKYSPNMTPEEKAALQREIDDLDRAYAASEAFDLANSNPDAEPEEDEMELLRKAGLNMGQP